MKNTVFPLFPCPLVVCGMNYRFSDAERSYIAGLEMIDNNGNQMSRDEKILDNRELAGLRTFVDSQIVNFKKNLLQVRDDNEIYITQSWANQSAPGQFHPKHRHPNSIVSGVLFVGENADSALPPIRFHRTFDMFPVDFSFGELNEFNASCREFDPEDGMLMLFPSQVEHDVERNKSTRVRTSISFNTYVRGVVGGKSQLTEVTIG